ncbi:MAG: cytochrome c [Rhodomicrobium sp.]|nr:cytochrome c [Rhodomicrobium sp.]
MHKSLAMLGVFLVAAMAAAPSSAADAVRGQELARSLCSNCHIVGPGEARAVVNADIPSFMAIAAKEGQSEDKIKAAIISPHPIMPNVQLTKPELDAVAAYIMSLKKP